MVLDPYGGNLLLPRVKEIVGSEAKVLAHFSQAANCIYCMMAPFSEGGMRDLEEVVEAIHGDEGRRKGREKWEIRNAVSGQLM